MKSADSPSAKRHPRLPARDTARVGSRAGSFVRCMLQWPDDSDSDGTNNETKGHILMPLSYKAVHIVFIICFLDCIGKA